MRNTLRDKWINRFPQNPIQTRYLRFLETPKGKVKTSYIKQAEKSFNKQKDLLRTKYTDILEQRND